MKSDDPKALTMFRNKPFLQHILDTLKNLNRKISPIIVIGHKKERIKELLGSGYTYAEQHEQLGTGHAVMSAKSAINSEHEMVLVLSTDQPLVSKETIERIIERHTEKNPTITLGTLVLPDFEDWRVGMYTNFGRIVRGDDGLVTKIVEFKDANEEEKKIKEVNPGLYAFNADWLWGNIDKLKNQNVKGEYNLTDMIKIASSQNKKIEAVSVYNIIEGLQPNSKEELEVMEGIAPKI
jgi:bifunctional UDP-N-acetylglucosamine pyrophosphorylase/glucosamine-1-phosphate N-acetyltransferase